jgi:hypothetical protein
MVRYHGNYVGPNWSAGKYQSSVDDPSVPAVDDFDQTGLEHDRAYARGENLNAADDRFYRQNIGQGIKRSVAALAVKGYSRIRGPRFRGNAAVSGETNRNIVFREGSERSEMPRFVKKRTGRSLKTSLAKFHRPASYSRGQLKAYNPPVITGTGIKLAEPVVTHSKHGCIVSGSEILPAAAVLESTSNWGLVSVARLSPVHYNSGRLGKYAVLYDQYRFKKVSITYVTAVGTSTGGNVLVEYQNNSQEPCRRFTATDFLPGVMTSGDATMMPIWENFTVQIPITDQKMKNMASDLMAYEQDECSNGDIFIYEKCTTASPAAGFFVLNYECQFEGPSFSPRTGTIPYQITTQNNWFYASDAAEQAATQVAAATMLFQSASSLFRGGTVYKIVLSGVSTNLAMSNIQTSNNSFARDATNIDFTVGGTTLYGCTSGGAVVSSSPYLRLYASLRGALAGGPSNTSGSEQDLLIYKANVATKPTFKAWLLPISLNVELQQSN